MSDNAPFSTYTYSEANTGRGQLIKFSCHPDDVEEVKKSLLKFRSISLPETKMVNIAHGSFGRYSRFDIKQHEYAGGRGGYIEALEVKNPPDKRCPFVIYLYSSSVYGDSCFFEFASLKELTKAFNKCWGAPNHQKSLKKQPGFLREVLCGVLCPWFYAIGEERLINDYALPEDIQNDPVFRFGQKFLVYAHDEPPSIKTCMGCIHVKERGERSGSEILVRIVAWDDGSIWKERCDCSNCRRTPRPRLIAENELWICEAIKQFHEFLTGHKERIEIPLINGQKFIGNLKKNKTKAHTVAGNYYAWVTLEDGGTNEGQLDFDPTPEHPDVVTYIEKGYAENGKKVKRIKIKRQSTEDNSKKWSGVFWS